MANMTIEPVIKIWYDALRDQNKMLGMKCKKCGYVEFPPVPICNSCGYTEMEWVEISGNAVIESMGFSPMGVPPYTDDPCVIGFGRIAEGACHAAMIMDKGPEDFEDLFDKLPIECRVEPVQMKDEIYYPNFRIGDIVTGREA